MEGPDIFDNPEGRGHLNKWEKRRNLGSFWLLGLCNNFAYVVMLSAAYDILQSNEPQPPPGNSTVNPVTLGPPVTVPDNETCSLVPECNNMGTGIILLADILPTLVIKLTAPLYMQSVPYYIRIMTVVIFSAASFPIVAASHKVWISVLGVVCASIGSGFGEISFLSLSAHYESNVISAWGSGTGMAGVAGALSYAGLVAAGLSPRTTLYIMIIVPAIMVFSYFFLLVKPSSVAHKPQVTVENENKKLISSDSEGDLTDDNESIPRTRKNSRPTRRKLSFKEKFQLVGPLLKYMIPLGLVYFAEYFINQALYELILFESIFLSYIQQYRVYQVIYQFGVLISRSSVNMLHIKKIWILSILQFINIAVLLLQIFFHFIPSIWIVFVLILWEGLLGGAGYVNTFYNINEEVDDLTDREFSQGVASVSDSTGIAIAGFAAIPVHNLICNVRKPCH